MTHALTLLVAAFTMAPADYFAISVVDDATNRGVPLVELRTVAGVRYVTDSQGLVAFHDPALMDQKVFFTVSSHGYEFAADGFGFRGKALQITPGGSAELRPKRINVAERLYRITGEGIYRDSVLLGRETPIEHPLLNAQVSGSDSVQSARFRGKLHWFWGDTNRPAYALGLFHVPGAVSKLPSDGGIDPARGVNLEYFKRDDGFAASLCEMPGEGPTWIDGLCVINDPQRGERMFAKYVKVRKFLEVYERGLVEFDAEKNRFEKRVEYDFAAPLYPLGHAFAHTENGIEYRYFCNPYPIVRVRATAEALADPRQFEAFTCLAVGSSAKSPKIDRDRRGRVRWGWKANTPAPTPETQAAWIKSKLLKPDEAILALRDIETGKPVIGHAGTVAYNEYRGRWVMITAQVGGTSYLGEIWYAEAEAPTGPWIYARKVVTHDKYSFYNPRHHPLFDQQGGRRIFFEGTYTEMFSGNTNPTPRYEYNQIMYSLDLADERLSLPLPVGETWVEDRQRLKLGLPSAGRSIAFLALDRSVRNSVPVAARPDAQGELTFTIDRAGGDGIAFYALAVDAAPETTVALYDWVNPATRRHFLGVEGRAGPKDYVRAAQPLCRVWRFPIDSGIPWN